MKPADFDLCHYCFITFVRPDGHPQSRNSSKQVTGVPIRLLFPSTAETHHSVRNITATGDKDLVVIEQLSQKKEPSESGTYPLDSSLEFRLLQC